MVGARRSNPRADHLRPDRGADRDRVGGGRRSRRPRPGGARAEPRLRARPLAGRLGARPPHPDLDRPQHQRAPDRALAREPASDLGDRDAALRPQPIPDPRRGPGLARDSPDRPGRQPHCAVRHRPERPPVPDPRRGPADDAPAAHEARQRGLVLRLLLDRVPQAPADDPRRDQVGAQARGMGRRQRLRDREAAAAARARRLLLASRTPSFTSTCPPSAGSPSASRSSTTCRTTRPGRAAAAVASSRSSAVAGAGR